MVSKHRKLGSHGPEIAGIALGCAAMSPKGIPCNDDESISTIQYALDCGINLIDTADFYGGGHNELLIGKAFRDRRDRAVLFVKFGGLRSPDGRFLGIDARPVAVAVKNSRTSTFCPFKVTQASLPLLIRSKGAIVNILLLASIAPVPVMPGYSISKAVGGRDMSNLKYDKEIAVPTNGHANVSWRLTRVA